MRHITINKLICGIALLALLTSEVQAQTLASRLYGVTGDGGTPAETLFVLDKTDASSTFVMTLGNGDEGEEIAFNPDDGLLYHASGKGAGTIRILETIHPGTLAITNIPLSGFAYTEVTGMTYEGSGVFLASHRLVSGGISTLTSAGVAANIGPTDAPLTGLAYVGPTLYAVERDDDKLHTINPLTGVTLTEVTITLSEHTVYGGNGLATDPVDGTLWAILKTQFRFPTSPTVRTLVTIDPTTGDATLIGDTDVVGMAGIAFVSGDEVIVTSSVGTGLGSISPLGAQSVISDLTTTFTLTPDPGHVIESVGGTCGGTLVDDTFTTDVITAACTVIANFEPEPPTKLYGVTGDGGLPPETLFRLDMSDASSTLVLTLGNGNDGEEIAFNRDDGLLYHISGQSTGPGSDPIFESIDLTTLAITPIPLSGFNFKEISGLTYSGPGGFLASDREQNTGLSNITAGGVVANIGPTETTLSGLAIIGTTVYAVAKSDALLRTIDPATGSTLGSVTITMPGYTLSGANGLTTNPDDNSLWAILKTGLTQPYDRALATIDPVTGVATYIGTMDVPGMAGLAFEFIPCDPCDVTPSVGGGPGAISPSTVQNVAYGDTTAFTLTPDPHYHVDFVDGTCGGSLASDVFTTAEIWTHCEVVAYFAIDTYDLVYTAGPGGTISGTTPQTVDYGTDGTPVTAVPDPFHHFVDWSDSVLTATRTDTFVTADISVTANFEIDNYTVTSSVGTGSGGISPLGGQQVDHGSTTQFTLTPDIGHHIDSVGGTCTGSLAGDIFTTDPITSPCTVVANFAIDTFTLTYTAGANGSISGTSPQIVEYGADGTAVTANPDANHHFVDWSDAVLTASRTDTNVMADISVTANFEIDTHTVTSSVGTPAGNISPLGGQEIDHGSTTQFTLTPNTGYHIDSVGGTCGGSLVSNVYTTAAITGDCTVVANFAIDTFTLTYTAGANGSITGTSPQTVDYGTDGTPVTAVADTNYHFEDWSDGVLTATRTDTNVMADLSVTANFASDTHTVTSSVGTPAGSINPLGGQSVDHGNTTQFTLTPDPNYHIDSVGGTCGGTLVSNVYTTAAITADCTVIANFAIDTHTVTSSVGTPAGSINPLGGQEIGHGSTAQFTLTPDPNYHIDSVGGTCGGSLVSNTYTTSAITTDCTVVANFAIDTHTVTSSVGTPAGNISPLGGQSVDHGLTTQFTLTPDPNYHIDSVSGTCGGSLVSNTFTTSAITADCTVVANFAIDTHTVTSSVGTPAGNISPLGGQSVDHGLTTQFTLTPDPNYHIDSVGGTCGGSLVSDTYTTSAITTDCTVIANFAIDTHTVTSSVGTPAGSISPLGAQEIDHGSTTQFTLTPDPNYHIDSVGGTCGGSLVSNTFTTSAITADCTVIANFEIDTHTVTASVGAGNGNISPLGGQSVDHGDTAQFTLTPDPNYHIDSVGGTCGGSLNVNVFTTNAVTTDCTVIANFAIDTHTLTSSVGTPSGSISPLGSQEIDHGDSTQFTLTPDPNYHIDSVGGTCGGSLVSNTYTTSAITADCTVIANFAIDTHTVTSSVGTPAGSINPLGGQSVDHGDDTQFTLTPNTGYHIDSVGGSCGGSLVSNVYTTDPITGPCTVVANFAIDTFTLTYTAGANGSITGTSPQTVDYGSDGAPVTAVPDPNYHFVDWSDGAPTATRTDTNVMADISVTANFAIDTHTVTSSVGTPAGSISPLGGQSVNHGATTQFTLTPDPNYHIESVGGTCGGSLVSNTYTTSAITADCTVIANFAIDTFTLTYTAGANGSITGTSPQTVDYGSDGAPVTAVPDSNYHFVDWSDGVPTATRTDTNVMADISVTANFAIDTHTVTSSVGTPAGSISPLGGQSVNHGATTQFTLTPDPNYHIESVGGTCGGSLVSNTYTTSAITADCTVIANFAIDTHTVTSSVGTPAGSINPLGGQSVDHGDTTQFTLTPNTGYHIDSVGGTCGGSLVSNVYTTSAITGDCTVVANFAIDTFTLTYTAGANGSITGASPQTVDYGTDGSPVTAVPDPNYHFVDWSDGVPTATRTDTNVMADLSVTANFEIDSYTVTSSVGTPAGSISPLGGQSVDHGDTTQFTLTPNTGYHIDSVGGTCGGSLVSNVYTTAAITGDCTVIANFAIDTFTLTYTAGSGGSISGTSPQTVDYGADGSPVTAVPDPNDLFVDWSDGVLTATRTDTNVTADISVTANFETDTYSVTSSVGTPAGSISPLGPQEVDHGETTQFTLTPAANYHIESVGGTCGGALVNDTYTTAAITADCTVIANFEIDTHTVTASVGTGNGNISPLGAQEIDHGATTQFTLTPDTGHHIESVGGTCGGTLLNDTYTTAAITTDCTVIANFAIDTFTLTYTAGSGGSISGTSPQTVDYGTDGSPVTAVPDPNYFFVDWSDGVPTATRTDTNVTADISVTANFATDTYTVTSSVGTGAGSISPLGGQEIDHGETTQFTLTPDDNYHIDSVGGTCGGSLVGNVYTTTAITAECTVVANFAETLDKIFANGFE